MCGISGIAGPENIARLLLSSIRNLEYRGYDSCGVAILNNGLIEVRKEIGSVDEVEERVGLSVPSGTVGIAHTRWATHGGVSPANAHPHLSCQRDFAVVHNGIISNYRELKEELLRGGHRFSSETDTETIAHLIEAYYQQTQNVEDALVKSLQRLEGSYAVAVISPYEPGKIFCARKESPLILGLGSDQNFVGSDFNAFIEYTKNAIILEDGEYGIVTRDTYVIKKLNNGEVCPKSVSRIEWDIETAKKGGYPHYMLKEIYEQPQAVINALQVDQETIRKLAQWISSARQTYWVGAGTTHYVSLVGQYYFSALAGRYFPCVSSDEFPYLGEVGEDSLVVAISQSGETFDTMNTLKYAKSWGARTAAIVNVMGSSIARTVDLCMMQGSGPEICVVSTKAAFSQMILLVRLAVELAQLEGKISSSEKAALDTSLQALPEAIRLIVNEKSGFIRNIAYRCRNIKNWLFLGRGVYYPISLEVALKMKEVTYLHAEGMAAGFLKHGTLALIDPDFYTVVMLPPQEEKELYSLTLGNAEEVKARSGPVIGIHFGETPERLFDEEVRLSPLPKITAPFAHLVVGQLLSYFTATALQRSVDKPRSLAKSVTVA
ncbi:MAG: glutamine--fructose-6-phosphate transaminase (isomerizing) [Candidatus Tectomicrobia bacterium]|uniref:Glutamine--fructose-6-phosphate aminotransferase [isomerizing] n=1 Tax=Tectimicrobiota bacterium TaxID=2528274 RepID=A0A932CM70_UNCTE|nr:glutamine--fructose-6-phosphate transaminase (isomerizing) [Candidatus Tectomicrobia bacterium]